jgi:hypothetical protein
VFGPFEQTDDVGYVEPDEGSSTHVPLRKRPPHPRRRRHR